MYDNCDRSTEGGPAGGGEDVDESRWVDRPGSNAFAVAGAKTASGKPILLGNPHLSWSSLYWEAHVRVPGKIDFYGSTLVGIPVLRAGFNDRLGFVTTNNAPDLDDIFALTVDSKNPDAVLFDGRSVPLVRRNATARVRNEDGSVVEESREYLDVAARSSRVSDPDPRFRREVDASRRLQLL